MAAPISAEESVGLHNRLMNLSFEEELAEIEGIQWRLQTVIRRQPGNVGARVALIKAFRTGGKREDAVDQASFVTNSCSSLDTQEMETYVSELVGLGLYDRAKPLFARELSKGLNSRLSGLALLAAVASGDLPWLRQISCIDGDDNHAADYLEVVEGSGLADHFGNHQGIVSSIVGPRQCRVAVDLSYDPDEPDELPGIVTYTFIPEIRAVRRELEQEIHEALENYYATHGLAPGIYIGHLEVAITGVPFPATPPV